MEKAITILLVINSILLMASILFQQRSASLGGAFGGDSNIYRSRRGVEKLLFQLTIILALAFIALAVAALIV